MGNWVIGVILAIIASFLGNLGTNLQKLAHQKNTIYRLSHPEKNEKWFPEGSPKMWFIGILSMIGCAICDFLALGFAPQSVVAPLGSLTLIANVIFAPILLKEVVSRLDIMSTMAISFGCTLCIAFSTHTEHDFTAEELYALFRSRPFLVYGFGVLSLGIAFFSQIQMIYRTRLFLKSEFHLKMHRFLLPALSGLTGAQNVLFAKCCSTLVLLWFGGYPIFSHFETYCIFIGLALSLTFQIRWLNEALSMYESTYVVPVFQCFWIGVSVISGVIVYQEFVNAPTKNILIFLLGILITIGGVILLSKRKAVNELHKNSENILLDVEISPISLSEEYGI